MFVNTSVYATWPCVYEVKRVEHKSECTVVKNKTTLATYTYTQTIKQVCTWTKGKCFLYCFTNLQRLLVMLRYSQIKHCSDNYQMSIKGVHSCSQYHACTFWHNVCLYLACFYKYKQFSLFLNTHSLLDVGIYSSH